MLKKLFGEPMWDPKADLKPLEVKEIKSYAATCHLDTEIEKLRDEVDSFLEVRSSTIDKGFPNAYNKVYRCTFFGIPIFKDVMDSLQVSKIPDPRAATYVLAFNIVWFGGITWLLSLTLT